MGKSLNRRITPWSLLSFAAPSIIMMVFMSLYTIVDGIFVSRFVGSNALSSLNIVYPVVNVAIAIAMMLASGGNAIISKYLGEENKKRACESLTQFVTVCILVSLVIVVISQVFLTEISRLLGSNEVLLADCKSYLGMVSLFIPACMLQTLFQMYLVTAGRPTMGLLLMIGAGIVNAVLDYVLIVICDMGVAGAALATGIGQCIPAIAGLVFFMFSKGELRFTGFKLSLRELGHACYNGSSEMVSELSNSVVTVLFNLVLMRLAGEAGVAAISILLYGQFLFNAFYLGFTIGISPIVGFQYGAKDKKKLRSIYKIAFLFVAVSAVILTVIAEVLATWIITVFTHDSATFELAEIGFKIFAVNFLFSGLNITSSGFFTALSNGKVSAIISFSRTFIFTVLSLLILPHFLKIYGAWLAVPIAEAVTLLVTMPFHKVYFIGKGEKNYLRG